MTPTHQVPILASPRKECDSRRITRVPVVRVKFAISEIGGFVQFETEVVRGHKEELVKEDE